MSFLAIQWAFKQKCRNATQQMILTALANFANEQGVCWPSKNTLADVCRLSKAAVCSNLTVLCNDGLIDIEKRGGEPGISRQTSSLIRLNMDAACLVDGQTGVQQEDRGTVHDVDRYKNLSDMNQSKEPINTLADLEAEFEEFWKLYPRRPNNPKHPAKLKYMHARRKLGVKRETIVNSLNSYAASRKGQDPSFTKMAATWLNQRCWEDAPVEEDQKPQQAQPSDKAKLIMAVFPGMPGDVGAVNEIIRTQDLNVDEVVEAAKKYALLLKQRRADGFETPPMLLDRWLKFAWREMSQYEFCRVGMENRLSVRPKRQKATA